MLLLNEGGVVGNIHISLNFIQPSKIELPKLVTLFGIVIDVKLLQNAKALSAILVTPSGIVADFKAVQL